MVVGSIFGGGVGGVVGLLTFKGECSTQKNRLQILDLRRLASLHFCILNITLSFCQLYRILSEPPTYCGNFPVSVANVQKWLLSFFKNAQVWNFAYCPSNSKMFFIILWFLHCICTYTVHRINHWEGFVMKANAVIVCTLCTMSQDTPMLWFWDWDEACEGFSIK